MVSTATLVFVVISLILSVGLPVAGFVALEVKYPKQGMASAWLLGAAGFFVTQMLIRLPILTILQGREWFLSFAQYNPFFYTFSLAFTAGLFELAGRFAVAKLLRRNLTFRRALAAGLGHGGIEAILLIGMTYINNIIYIFMINSGTYDTLIAQAAAAGVDASQLELIRTQLVTMPPAMFALGGFERILAMMAHTAMSMVVCFGVAKKKILPGLLVCLGIHTFIDLTAGMQMLAGTVLSQTAVYLIIYAILVAVAAVSLVIIRKLRAWPETEVSYDSEQ